MKKLLYISFSLLLFTACNKKLDQAPSDAVPQDDVTGSDEALQKALNGAYDLATGNYLLNGDLQLYSELLGANGEVLWTGTFNQPREIFEKQILTNNSYVTNTWLNAYAAINVCNTILDSINVINEDERDRVKGEALFLRAELYFELVRFFSKPYSDGNASSNLGAQIVTVPTTDVLTDANYVARSTVQETYDFILSDLTEAKSLLPEDNGVYASTYTASAILSRVYLQMGDYAKARDEANTVIESGYYGLTSAFSAAFNNDENSGEDIFGIQVSEQDGTNDFNLFWSIPDYGGRSGDVDIEQDHLDLYDANDDRLAMFYLDDLDIWRTGKWQQYAKNIPLIRLAEMYLTRAECNFRLGSTTGATPFEDMETIRGRSGLSTTQAFITLDNILKERHLELAFEGERIHDIKRLQQSVDGFDYDANELVLPIPLREINASKGALQQNEGYN